jgi:hypothetical protein
MGYSLAMKVRLLLVPAGMIFLFFAAPRLRADEVDMQSGDRYFGKVLTVSTDTVVLESAVLGVINVPRTKVAGLALGTNAAAPKAATDVAQVSMSTNPPAVGPSASPADTNADLSAALRNMGANTNFIGQVRQQLLAGNPGAASNYDEMVSGLLDGSMNMDDLRHQAQSAVDQLREMKRQAGPQADPSIDAYLEVLDNFLNETAGGPTNAVSAPQPKPQAP